MKKLIILSAAVMMSLAASAQDSFEYTYEGLTIYYQVTNAETHTVQASYPGDEFVEVDDLPTVLAIPSTVNYEGQEYTVTAVRRDAFSGYGGYTTVKLPATVKKIGKGAFNGTDVLMVDYPDLEAVSSMEFAVAEENPLSYIHNLCIDGKRVSKLVMPQSIKVINPYAFTGASITSLNMGTVEEIGTRAFSECKELKEVEITPSVKSFGSSAFYQSDAIEKVSFPGIEEMCGLEFFTPQSNPLYYGHNLYIDGEQVTKLAIPYGVESINDGAFAGLEVKSVEIPNSVTFIGEDAFRAMHGPEAISIPGSVATVGDRAFNLCDFSRLTFEESETPLIFGLQSFPVLHVTDLYVGRPVGADNLKLFKNLESVSFGNLVEEVADSQFANMSSLKSVAFGSALKSIGESAFSGCKGLTEVVLPPSLQTVGAKAFANTSLTTIEMGPNVQMLGSNAFQGCPVESVAITAQATPAVGDKVFSNYDWTLLVQGEAAKNAYAASSNLWSSVKSELLVNMTFLKYEGQKMLIGQPGDTFAPKAYVRGSDASLKSVFWMSTNPSVATVDLEGVVTLQPGVSEENAECQIIAQSLYFDAPELTLTVINGEYNGSGVEEIVVDGADANHAIDFTAPYDVYNLDGRHAGNALEGLAKGIYVVRQGEVAKKVAVK